MFKSQLPSAWFCFWVALLVKLLLVPAYFSTDFDVHRNWLAVTHSLPLREWYTNAVSEWTLDYPPFFAWFEWFLAQFAPLFDEQMLHVTADPYRSPATVLFQRLTVIASDMVLFAAVVTFVRSTAGQQLTGGHAHPLSAMIILCFANPGLLFVDAIHFQYNAFLLGLFLFAVEAVLERRDFAAAVLFAVVLNFKHIFLYVAPVFFVYLLRHYCFVEEDEGSESGGKVGLRQLWMHRVRFSVSHFVTLGAVVLAVFALSFGPFVATGQLGAVLSRMFPFQRGLTHAYWAPNVWALYNFADTILQKRQAFLHGGGGGGATGGPSFTSGLVAELSHVVLPTIKASHCALLTLVAMVPALAVVWRRPDPQLFLPATVYCCMCSFMLGYHVHEKAILMVTVPLALLALDSRDSSKLFYFLNTLGTFTLFPLLFKQDEVPIKALLLAGHALMSYNMLEAHRKQAADAQRVRFIPFLNSLESFYLWLMVPLELFVAVVHPLFVLPRLEFLPLMLVSVYGAVGCVYAWALSLRLLWTTEQRIALAEEEDDDDNSDVD